MKSVLLPLIGCAVWMAALEYRAAEADMPDCVGIRTGMAVTEARERLKTYDTNLVVRDVELQIPSLGEKPVLEMLFVARTSMPSARAVSNNAPALLPHSEPLESIKVEITLPPSRPVVWKVVRSLRFEPGKEQTTTALFAALAEKYGKESFTTEGFRSTSRYWVRDPQGNLLDGQAAKECSAFFQSYQASSMDSVLRMAMMLAGRAETLRSVATVNYMSSLEQSRPVLQNEQPCQTMRCVIAELSVGANRELVDHMQITVLDAGLDTRSREATRALIKQSDTAAEKQRVERAKQQPIPKL